jgi:sugar O-acyltransferase (sialic acid O-acetyltransferase NeuD family)
MTKQIGLLGDGGQANEAEAYYSGAVSFRAVTSDYAAGDLIDLEHPSEDQKELPVVAAVGAPALRKKLIELWSGSSYETIIAPTAQIHESSAIGTGTIISPSVVITTNVSVGKHTLVNVAATIQHDSVIGDYCTVGPGSHIGGKVKLGNGVFVGIGAIISNSVTVATGVVIAAGAVVPPHMNLDTENGVYVGVPARLITTNKEWLNEI